MPLLFEPRTSTHQTNSICVKTSALLTTMIPAITEEDRQKYREEGYHIIPQVIPPSLLKDLRREGAKAQEIARRIDGPQSQRLSALDTYRD